MENAEPQASPDPNLDPTQAETRLTPAYRPSADLGETAPSAVQRSQPAAPPLSETAPSAALKPAPYTALPTPPPPAPRKASRGSRWWPFLGLVFLILIAIGSGFSGYNAGIQRRLDAEATASVGELQRQYDLGVQDIGNKNYEIARQRFEYILSLAPDFPGAIDRLTEVLLAINVTATPTLAPTPTVSPTPDLRGVETLFSAAQAALDASDWTTAIEALLSLRKVDPAYNAVRVDGMLYLALRSRGVEKILNADLEGGTYDLALAERFGPLDAEAKAYRTWVDLYVTGASFWEIDWQQAVYYFGQLAPIAPGLRDAANFTSLQRYQTALLRYGDQLANAGEWCLAYEQYQAALTAGANPAAEPTAMYASQQCGSPGGENNGESTPEPGGPTPEPPTPTPTLEAYPSPTP